LGPPRNKESSAGLAQTQARSRESREKHWRGAAPTTAMTHIAIHLDGKAVDWMKRSATRNIREKAETLKTES